MTTTSADRRPFLTIAQAAEQLQVTTWTIRRAIKAGRLPVWQAEPGGAIRINPEDFDAYAQTGPVHTPQT